MPKISESNSLHITSLSSQGKKRPSSSFIPWHLRLVKQPPFQLSFLPQSNQHIHALLPPLCLFQIHKRTRNKPVEKRRRVYCGNTERNVFAFLTITPHIVSDS